MKLQKSRVLQKVQGRRMNLEELVPPFDLCNKIPAGEFVDSAFVYVLPKFASEAPKMLPREHEVVKIFTNDFFIYPAPHGG